jgi:short-subunit dehydrogenase
MRYHSSDSLATDDLLLDNALVWITGASRGIGAALAHAFAREGCRLALSARNAAMLEQAVQSIQSQHPVRHLDTIKPFACDVTDAAIVQGTAKAIAQHFGTPPDIVVNNAGIGVFAPFEQTSLYDFEQAMNTNVRGMFLCTQAVLPAMMERKRGYIININSIAAIKTFSGGSVYAASKAAMLALSRGIREETRSLGIKVLDVLPGATETAIWNADARTEFGHRMMRAEDVAEAVVSLLKLHPRLMPEEIVVRPQLGDL